jgi:hypothetical protein
MNLKDECARIAKADKSFLWAKESKTGNVRIISNIEAIDAFEIACHLSAAYILTGTDGKMLIPKKPEARKR